jgi:DNA replication protein DnaC
VVNTRRNLGKPTIINTNLTSAELRKTYTDRLSSRLMGEYHVFPFYGVDIRKQKIQK